MPKKVALITGITGQDGSYLTDLLLEKDYIVHGFVHHLDAAAASNIRHIVSNPNMLGKRLFLHNGAFGDPAHLRRVISLAKPDELYHLAGQTSPRISFELPETTIESVGTATLRLLEILRDLDHPVRFFYASSSEIFGTPTSTPQDESTPVDPTTPYGAAKALSQQMVKIYRTAYKMPACSGILYNHESPRRNGSFVTMKIARAAAHIKKGLQAELHLGNLTGKRDWGWAPDYVHGMWLMLQSEITDDFILATGRLHSVEELAEVAFKSVNLNWKDYVRHDPGLVTSAEPIAPCGNPAKAYRLLNWKNTVAFEDIIDRMVKSEYDKI